MFRPYVLSLLVLSSALTPSVSEAQATLSHATTLVIAPTPTTAAHAQALASAVEHGRVAVLYSAGGAVHRKIVQSLADQLGVEHRPYDLDPLHRDEFAGWLLANVLPANPGRVAMVIAPLEIIPFLLQRSVGVRESKLARVQRNELFTITLAPGYASLVRSRVDPEAASRLVGQ